MYYLVRGTNTLNLTIWEDYNDTEVIFIRTVLTVKYEFKPPAIRKKDHICYRALHTSEKLDDLVAIAALEAL